MAVQAENFTLFDLRLRLPERRREDSSDGSFLFFAVGMMKHETRWMFLTATRASEEHLVLGDPLEVSATARRVSLRESRTTLWC